MLLAVSGGRDSMAMFEAFRRLKSSMKLEIGVAHIEHGIRKYSNRDLEFVAEAAKIKGVPFYHRRLNVPGQSKKTGKGLEETARILRYRALKSIAKAHGFDRIATGHTASDQAETVLYRIVSGAGIKGISGILPVLDGNIIRPLLTVTRRDVDAFIRAQKISFVEDETNVDTAFTRNRVRHALLPLLEREFNPSVETALSRLAESARLGSSYIEEGAAAALAKVLVIVKDGKSAILDNELFCAIPDALKPAVLEMATDRVSPGSRLDAVHISAMIDAATGSATGSEVHLPGAIMKVSGRKEIRIERRQKRKAIARKDLSRCNPDAQFLA